MLINTLITYKPTTLWVSSLATLAVFLKVRARSSRALVLRAVRAVCGCQFAVGAVSCFKRRARVLVSCVRVVCFACVLFVPCLLCARPALACGSRVASGVRFSPRRFALRRLARPSSRQPRPRSFARPRFAVSASLRARARPPRASVLFVCLPLVCAFVRRPAGCASVRGVSVVFVSSASLALSLYSVFVVTPRFVCARFARDVRGCQFAVVRSRLSVCGCQFLFLPCFCPRPPSRSFLALLRDRARSSRVRLLVPLRFARAGRFD